MKPLTFNYRLQTLNKNETINLAGSICAARTEHCFRSKWFFIYGLVPLFSNVNQFSWNALTSWKNSWWNPHLIWYCQPPQNTVFLLALIKNVARKLLIVYLPLLIRQSYLLRSHYSFSIIFDGNFAQLLPQKCVLWQKCDFVRIKICGLMSLVKI